MAEPEETTFKVDCKPVALTDQIVLRIGQQSIAVPAYRRDDNDFDRMTILKAVDFDLTRGEISLRYRPLEEPL